MKEKFKLYSVRDKDGNIMKRTRSEDEAKQLVKVNKEWTYKQIGRIWP